jgi:hypothetical protein
MEAEPAPLGDVKGQIAGPFDSEPPAEAETAGQTGAEETTHAQADAAPLGDVLGDMAASVVASAADAPEDPIADEGTSEGAEGAPVERSIPGAIVGPRDNDDDGDQRPPPGDLIGDANEADVS